MLKQINGVWQCVKHAVFLPVNQANGVQSGGDQPSLSDSTVKGMGIWADLLPGQTCTDAQSCWDMCFFCDGRIRYNPSVSAVE